MTMDSIAPPPPDVHRSGGGGRRRPAFTRSHARTVTLAVVLLMGVLAVAGHQLAAGASPSPGLVACPRLAGTLPTITVPPCPPPCPVTTVPSPVPDPVAGSPEIIRCPCPIVVAGICPPPTIPRTTVTPPPSTIPVDGFAIAGITENRLCTGPPPLCQNPFAPASDDVTIRQDGQVVAKATSDAQGRFRIPVGPGTYEAQAAPHLGVGLAAICPAQTVTVSGPPVPTVITLQCTVVGP